MTHSKIIDNKRKLLSDILNELSQTSDQLSIATGYWDLPGTQILFDNIKNYKSIRLLIGQEPLMPRYRKELKLDDPDEDFPDKDINHDLETLPQDEVYRKLITDIKKLTREGRLEVRVYRRSFLHAKCYIFGSYDSETAIGIIGSSNFTGAGLTTNTELNALEDDYRIVKSTPKAASDDYGHLSWFDSVWNDELTEPWNGMFTELLENSPVGDLTYSPYDMYIRTLSELYQDEIVDDEQLSEDTGDILFEFQLRNAQLLLRKLNKFGLAMLADSVGLGKTITAGAVIKHYAREKSARRIYVIAPAGLTSQWRDDLAKVHKLFASDFEVISMQDKNKIEKAREIDKYAPVDLFIVDEAHNLRNDAGTRHQQILEWFSDNPTSKVLLLTATPINNKLTDFVNQIQLAAKGSLASFPVVYPTSKKNEVIDFFDAVKRLSSDMKKLENKGEKPDFDKVNRIMKQGLRHFLVRTTRRGIEKEFGGLLGSDGKMQQFPKSTVELSPYQFSSELLSRVNEVITANIEIFNNHDPRKLDIDSVLEHTQRTQHPLDLLDSIVTTKEMHTENVFVSIFQVLLLLGFCPYRSETYQHRFYGKSPRDIKELKLKLEESFALQSQMSIHNMLRISLLKRLESSQYALRKSLENYRDRLQYFNQKLNEGHIVRFKDIDRIQNQFGDDLELVINHNSDAESEDQIELTAANPDKYNVSALKADIQKDLTLLDVLIQVCEVLNVNDDKLVSFCALLEKIISEQKAGNKILIFSYYSDTIAYLAKTLPDLMSVSNFDQKSAFVSGSTKNQLLQTVRRFSPKSQGADIPKGEQVDYLFATDVLSEGQNLQDCGTLINFDLHWNPVRMIQRNGRINRLGSDHTNVYIYNMHPETQLESYLKLVKRLQSKIEVIRHSIGTDQSILGEEEMPQEFVDQEEDRQQQQTIDLYDPTKATATLNELGDDSDFLSEDEYIIDLRNFIKDASGEAKTRIAGIPLGKWGYLPKTGHAQVDAPTILALTRSRGITSETGIDFETHIFIESDVNSGYMVDAVETVEALKFLRTSKEDDKRQQDRMSYNRKLAKKLTIAAAREEAASKKGALKVTPSITKILNELARVLPGVAVDVALENIVTKQDLKLMRDLFNMANRDLKVREQLLPSTIDKFDKAVSRLETRINDEKLVNRVDGVLFYAK